LNSLKAYFSLFQASEDPSSASDKVQALENRIAELEEEKGNNLWLQEELSQLKSEKESLQELLDAKVAEYESRIQGLSELLENSSKQIESLERQHQQQEKVEVVTSAVSAASDGWASEEPEIDLSEVNAI